VTNIDEDPFSGQIGSLVFDVSVRSNNWSDKALCATLSERALRSVFTRLFMSPSENCEISFSFVGDEEIRELNREYRGKDKATNVLSFPGCDPEDLDEGMKFAARGGPPVMLGDIIVSFGVVEDEAALQNKTLEEHLTHLLVHGLLHLLGYDHTSDDEAEEMEGLEREILHGLNISNPYKEQTASHND
jgi:probable rRNA maturation factor